MRFLKELLKPRKKQEEMQARVLQLRTAVEGIQKKDGYLRVRGLILELEKMGRVPLTEEGYEQLRRELHNEEIDQGGVEQYRRSREKLCNEPWNSKENFFYGNTREKNMELVIDGKKPAALLTSGKMLNKEEKEICKAGRVKIYRNRTRRIIISSSNKVSEFYTIETILLAFSSLHPTITAQLVRAYDQNENKPPGVWLAKPELEYEKPGSIIVYHILSGLFFGYDLQDIYTFSYQRMFERFTPSDLD